MAAAKAAGVVTLNLGIFINAIISFIIIAFAVFLVIKGINRMRRGKEVPAAEPVTKECLFSLALSPSRLPAALNVHLQAT